jgi:CRISPR type I-E-associated protein CasB/Cse2
MTPASPPSGTSRRQRTYDGYDAFVTYLTGLCATSTKAQADLRSGLGRPLESCALLHRYLVPRLPDVKRPGRYDDRRRAHYTVAALIGGRPRAARDAARAATKAAAAAPADAVSAGASVPWWQRPNLGASLAEAVNKKLIKPDTAEADLHLMTRQGSEALGKRLPSLTRHLLTGGVAIDWAVLLDDLAWWNEDRDRIATRWLEAYFRARSLEDRNEPQKENV